MGFRLPGINRLLALSLSLSLTHSFSAAASETKFPFQGRVNSDKINLRSDARISSAIICVLPRGENVEAASMLYDWYKIRLPKSAPAYIKKDFCACLEYGPGGPGGPAATNVTPAVKKYCQSAKVTGNRVNIRLSPSESSPVIGMAGEGEIVNILSETDGWLKIEPTVNCFGWVHKKFIAAETAVSGTDKPREPAPLSTVKTKNRRSRN